MLNTDIRKYTWYSQYIVQPADLTGLQEYIRASIESSLEGLSGASIVSGLRMTNVGGMTLECSEGGALSPAGRLMVLGSPGQVTLGSDPSLPRRSLVILRPTATVVSQIVNPTAPPTLVTFQERFDATLVVIPGTPAASPAYPSKQANDVVIMGLLIPAGASSLSVTNFELGPREVPKQLKRKIREITASHSAASGEGAEDIIEFDASTGSGTISLPPASVMAGSSMSVVKTDSSANIVRVQGNGGEQISGQTEVDLDTQWQSVTLYAYKNAWRML